MYVCMYVYVGFKTFFYVVRHLYAIASYLPTGLHLGFFRSWPSLFLPSSFSSVFLVPSFVSTSTSMLRVFWVVFLLPFLNMAIPCELVLFNLFIIIINKKYYFITVIITITRATDSSETSAEITNYTASHTIRK